MGRITWTAIVLGCLGVAGCMAAPYEPEGYCSTARDCGEPSPECRYSICTRSCATSADCAELTDQTSCDGVAGVCVPPCMADQIGSFACRAGDRIYCADDPTLPCTVCPSRCAAGTYCDAASVSCLPQRATGEACVAAAECTTGYCNAGLCGAAQGEPCTDATCDGVCAVNGMGATFCIRARCPSNCADLTTGGYEWTCVTYESTGNSNCYPIESCIWESGCRTFTDSTCGQSCRSGGGCWTYCVPNALYPG